MWQQIDALPESLEMTLDTTTSRGSVRWPPVIFPMLKVLPCLNYPQNATDPRPHIPAILAALGTDATVMMEPTLL